MEINRIFRTIVGCLGLALVLSACGEEHKDVPIAVFEAEYSFDPQTIQAAIDAGQPGLFHEEWNWRWFETETPPPERETRLAPAPGFVPLPWTEADFRRVFNTFIEQDRKDFAGDLEPQQIIFDTDCQDATIGIQRMSFNFFEKQGSGDYLRWGANIDVSVKRLKWSETILNDVGDEKPLLAKGRITAEAALQMAEQAGGAALRAQVKDNCFISGDLLRSGAVELDGQWRITYHRSANSYFFEVRISSDGRQVRVVVTPEP